MTLRPCVISLVLSATVACGGSDDRDPPPGGGNDGSPSYDGSGTNTTDAGATLTDAAMNALGPVVEIIDPTEPATGDYSSDAIVTDDRITVRCQATANPDTGDRVDDTSVVISYAGSGGSGDVSAQPTTVPNVYAADLQLGDLSNGGLVVRCTARDTSDEARANSDEVATFLDLGPHVQILTPLPGTSYANQTDVVFTVTAAPVADNDDEADPDLDAVTVSVGGVAITDVGETGGTFTATIDFDDPSLFDPTLDGAQTLVVRAPNVRSTEAVVRVESLVFNVDSSGPVIEVDTPEPGQLVSGIVTLEAKITDPAGIMPGSTVATIAGVEFDLLHIQGDDYAGSFDTRVLTGMIYPNIIVRARDMTGNQSSHGYVVGLDNTPPIATLDSPMIRESKLNQDNLLECSREFDPLGDDAVNDGQSVPQLFEIRARSNDLGNYATQDTGIFVPKSNVDKNGIQLFILDDSTRPLIVDTNGDGECDEINPHLVPTSIPVAADEVARFDLVPIPDAGDSFFDPALTPTDFDDSGHGYCSAGEDQSPPKNVCISVALTRVIREEIGNEPSIYGIPPLTEIACLGNAVDAVATNLGDGWVCAAVRVEDNLGNVAVSPPMRLCIEVDQSGGPSVCDSWGSIDPSPPDDCTGTYSVVNDTVDGDTDCSVTRIYPDDDYDGVPEASDTDGIQTGDLRIDL